MLNNANNNNNNNLNSLIENALEEKKKLKNT